MADNFTQATVSPALPASLFSDDEIELLSTACGLRAEKHRDDLYFFAELSFNEDGEDEEGEPVDLLALLQGKLRQLDPASYPHITIHGACTCSKMRDDEFGGFAHVITRADIRSFSTWRWLARQTGQHVLPADPPGATIGFDPERQRKAASRLLAALKFALEFLEANDDGEDDVTSRIAAGSAAIAEAEAACIPEAAAAAPIITQE